MVILLILLIIVFLVVFGIFLFIKEIKRKPVIKKRLIIPSTLILVAFATFYLLSYAFSAAFEDHYDVKQGTLLWFITMNNSTIKNFPIVYAIKKPVYNHIGGDSPGIAAGWEIEYESKGQVGKILTTIKEHLKKEGFLLNETSKPACNWREYPKANQTFLYSAVSEKGECLDLALIKFNNRVKVQATILY